MKKNSTNLNNEQEQLTEHQLHELENDAVWSLLRDTEKSSQTQASPMFARNVMREIRLNHSIPTSQSLWTRLVSPRFNKIAIGFGLVAIAALVVISKLPNQNSSQDLPTNQISSFEKPSVIETLHGDEKATELDQFTDEMLKIANEDPFYISEEEIEIAMQM